MRFASVEIGEFVERGTAHIQTGPFGTQLKASDYTADGTAVINVRNIGYGILRPEKLEFVDGQILDKLSTHLLEEGDIVFGRKGAVDRHLFVDTECTGWMQGSDCIRLRFFGEEINRRYVSYALLTKHHQEWVLMQAGNKATMASLNHDIICRISLRVPPLDIQTRIADILSAYDDLIENNRRRMALLEDAARQLYREWFVRLRFPGHEHTPIKDGLPEGWERKTLADLCESVDYGYTASAEREEVGPRFLRITDIVPNVIDWTAVPFCPIEAERLEKFRLIEGDIVIARTGATVGYAKRLHKRHPETVFASYLIRLRIKLEIDNLIVGTFVESDDFKSFVQTQVGGAAQPNANAKVLASAQILIPTPNLQREFHDFAEPLIDQREILQLQIQQLGAARDLLLPRLMSGEIAV